MKKHSKDPHFWKFRRQLFHSSMSSILELLKPGMTTPNVVRCCDGHFRQAVYGIGLNIADYPEQALLCCIMQGWCPKFVFVSHFSPSCLCLTRCTARLDDLDNSCAGNVLCGCEHTEMLVKEFELGDLWDDYGLVGDIIVRFFHICFCLRS